MSPPRATGKIPFTVGDETFETWYEVVGDLSNCPNGPVIALHGGPGMSHDYMRPIAELVSHTPNTAVIFYDQIGNGRSSFIPHKEMSFWTIDLFIDELENLIRHFKIQDRFRLIGHSWGVPLACEFAIRRQPKGLRRVVLQNGWTYGEIRTAETAEVRKQLPQEIQEVLRKGEAAGEYATPEYLAANIEFFENFACRVKPWPEDFKRTLEYGAKDDSVLKAMRDESGECIAGRWDIRGKVHLMRQVQTLIITGEYDYITARCSEPLFQGIDKVKWVHFINSSHTPHLEEPERYMKVVGDFLAL